MLYLVDYYAGRRHQNLWRVEVERDKKTVGEHCPGRNRNRLPSFKFQSPRNRGITYSRDTCLTIKRYDIGILRSKIMLVLPRRGGGKKGIRWNSIKEVIVRLNGDVFERSRINWARIYESLNMQPVVWALGNPLEETRVILKISSRVLTPMLFRSISIVRYDRSECILWTRITAMRIGSRRIPAAAHILRAIWNCSEVSIAVVMQ